MTKRIKIIITTISVFCFNFIFQFNLMGNNNLLKPLIIDTCFNAYYETVYTILDKNIYVAGDKINFKSYILNSQDLKLSNKSKILYYEISGLNNNAVLKWKSYINNGQVTGEVIIPDTVTEGLYYLHAYTNWSLNLANGYLFTLPVIITNFADEKQKTGYQKSLNSHLNISFLPEGGTWLDGVDTEIGVTGNITGEIKITDQDGNVINTGCPDIKGFTTFKINPDPYKNYFAQYMANGVVKSVELPEHVKKGFALKTTLDKDNLNIELIAKKVNTKDIVLLITHRGNIVKTIYPNIESDEINLSINRNNLPTGILDVLLIQNNQVINERLSYNQNYNTPALNIITDKKEYEKQEKIKLEISAKNLGQSDTALLNIVIREKDPFSLENKNLDAITYLNILSEINSSIWINKDFRNYSAEEINRILLSVSPGDYIWRNKGNLLDKCNYLPETQGYILSGRIINKITDIPLKNEIVLLSVEDKAPNLLYAKTNARGEFYFLLDKQYDNRELIFQLLNPLLSAKDMQFVFDNKTPIQGNSGYINKSFSNTEAGYLKYCQKIKITNLAFNPDLSKKDTIRPEISPISDYLYVLPDFSLIPAEYTELTDFNEICKNLIFTLHYKRNRNSKTSNYFVFDPENQVIMENPTTFFLNGMLFKDINYIKTLGSKDIKEIEMNRFEMLHGDLNFYGTVSIQTFDRIIPERYILNNVIFYKNLYQEEKNYLKEPVTSNNPITDLRQTIFWGSQVTITGDKKYTVEINTSLLKSEYIISVQGITKEGLPVSQSSIIKVK